MKKFILDNNVLKYLSNIRNERLLSFEIGSSERSFNRSYGKLRINCSNQKIIDIFNLEEKTKIDNNIDDISRFDIKIGATEEFKPYLKEDVAKISINEKIIDIFVVTDQISIKNKESLEFDEAIIIKTEVNSWTIYRTWQYDELIHFTKNQSYDNLYQIEEVKRNWNNYGEDEVSVNRIIKRLDLKNE